AHRVIDRASLRRRQLQFFRNAVGVHHPGGAGRLVRLRIRWPDAVEYQRRHGGSECNGHKGAEEMGFHERPHLAKLARSAFLTARTSSSRLLAHDSESGTGFRKDRAPWRNSSAIDST